MKTRFTTVDLISALHDLRKLIGLRVVNVYDIDNKTYLLKLAKPDSKAVILIESGARIHTTDFDYAKNLIPSGFSMKLRKHVRQKRLESVTQLGVDRIIDLQFGSGEVACHFIVELYDRGNLILTDFDYVILNVLRPRTDKENSDVRFAVREKYPLHLARQLEPLKTEPEVRKILENAANPNDNLRKVLTTNFPFGAALIEHSLLNVGISPNIPINKILKIPEDFGKIYDALILSNEMFEKLRTDPEFPTGVIIVKREKQANGDMFESYAEFHPMLYKQHNKENAYKTYDSFNVAIDEFFSRIESQKIDAKSMQKEKTALKKLENIQRDHETRLKMLQSNQNVDKRKAELIELNKELVDRAILVVNSALANQLSWEEIQESIDEAKQLGDKTARAFKSLKLDVNHVSLRLTDPFLSESDDEEEPDDRTGDSVVVDIDLGLGAFQNARKYYTQKKQSALKENKTIAASEKALKSAEAKTQDLLKQVQLIRNITKTRKTFWFEKFFWFISSDGFLVIGGRDAQQNELIVKRYLKPGDAYVHADIKGASSVIIKNRVKDTTADSIPPKTLSEAGTMAVSYSAAWEAKVVTSAWWVNAEQVSKTAPTGLYLGTGSFMIRGKKNFLPPCQLIMGFGIMFKLDDDSALEHAKMRKNEQILANDEKNDDGENNVETENEEAELKLDDDSDSDEEAPEGTQEPEGNEFPDVAVSFRHLSVDSESSQQKLDDEEYSVIQIGPRVVSVRNKGGPADKTGGAKKIGPNQQWKGGPEIVGVGKQEKNQQKPKRGQRAKLKKIKEKYKDQDEEERDLRLRLLGSAGSATKNDAKKEPTGDSQVRQQVPDTVITREDIKTDEQQKEGDIKEEKEDPLDSVLPAADEEGDLEADPDPDPEPDQDELLKLTDESTAALDSLSGLVFEKDVLLFALTTCAPYSAMNNFKFKVKLTPGTGKKGKATKTALQVFLKDKILTQREKELIKSLNDQDLSRNFPGKVKLSAPQLQAVKKKH